MINALLRIFSNAVSFWDVELKVFSASEASLPRSYLEVKYVIINKSH